MSNFADRLIARCRDLDSVVCVGLDPQPDRLPSEVLTGVGKTGGLAALAKATGTYCSQIIEVVRDIAVAVKPQAAFFECLGPAGMNIYAEVCRQASRAGLLVIADVKRGDIGSTASAYAAAFLGWVNAGSRRVRPFPADAVTVNPYLGRDSVEPFLEEARTNDAGVFVLVRTSNPSASQFQDLVSEGRPIYEHVARWVQETGGSLMGKSGYSSLGAVVGATRPHELERLRSLMPGSVLLLPGYGAQGATADDVAVAFDHQGLGAVVNASRSVIFAYEKTPNTDWRQAIYDAALGMRDDLNRVRHGTRP